LCRNKIHCQTDAASRCHGLQNKKTLSQQLAELNISELVTAVKKILKPLPINKPLLDALYAKEYGSFVRQASTQINLGLLNVILTRKTRIKLDINEISANKNLTALDLAEQAVGTSDVLKAAVIKLLVSHGALKAANKPVVSAPTIQPI